MHACYDIINPFIDTFVFNTNSNKFFPAQRDFKDLEVRL